MTGALATRQGLTLAPDPRRVIVKLFVPIEDAAVAHTRAHDLVDRIAELDADETEILLRRTPGDFGDRHRDLAGTFQHHHELVRHRVARTRRLAPTTRLLVGAYFSHEYAVEAAALSIRPWWPHPDQSPLRPVQLRVAVSLRQIDEGHLSSIGFASAVLGPGSHLAVQGRVGGRWGGSPMKTEAGWLAPYPAPRSSRRWSGASPAESRAADEARRARTSPGRLVHALPSHAARTVSR